MTAVTPSRRPIRSGSVAYHQRQAENYRRLAANAGRASAAEFESADRRAILLMRCHRYARMAELHHQAAIAVAEVPK